MKLYLVRHAEAVEESGVRVDGDRFLTPGGRSFFRRTARLLRRESLAPDLILTSPLVRAVQTAEILAETLGYKGDLRVDGRLISALSPRVLEEIVHEEDLTGSLVLVGHNPTLARLASWFLADAGFRFPKGAAVALEWAPGRPAKFGWLAAGDELYRPAGHGAE